MENNNLGELKYDQLEALEEVYHCLETGGFASSISLDDEYERKEIAKNMALNHIGNILKFDSEISPPDGMRMFDCAFYETADMRHFLFNMYARNIAIVKLDIDHVYGHLDRDQLDVYTADDLIGSVPKHKGLHMAVNPSMDPYDKSLQHEWKSITDIMSLCMHYIRYWLEFGKSTGVDILDYINFNCIPKKERTMLKFIIENCGKILDDNSKG